MPADADRRGLICGAC